MTANIQRKFETTCRRFFSRWRNAVQWRAVVGSQAPESGACGYTDDLTKTIHVADPDSTLTIVHEICHAVTHQGHGKRWIARIRQAADTAASLGDPKLSADLREEASRYESGDVLDANAAYVYGLMRNWIFENEGITLDPLIGGLCAELGVSKEQLLRKYKRLEREYEIAVRAKKNMLKKQQAFKRRMKTVAIRSSD